MVDALSPISRGSLPRQAHPFYFVHPGSDDRRMPTFVMGVKSAARLRLFYSCAGRGLVRHGISAREIIRERPVFKRERMVNLGILPYLFSKLFILGIIVGIQCLSISSAFEILGPVRCDADARTFWLAYRNSWRCF